MFIYCICTQYLVGAPFALITASIRRGMEEISLWHCWGGMKPRFLWQWPSAHLHFLVSCFSFSSWQYSIDSLCSGLVSLIDSLCSGLVSLIDSLCSGLVSLIDSLCSGLVSLIDSLCSGLVSLIDSLCSGLVSLIDSLCSGLVSLIDSLCSGLVSLIDSLCSGPVSLIDSLCSGLVSLIDSLCSGLVSLLASQAHNTWSFNQLLVLLAVWAGAKSCWKMKSASLKSWSAEGSMKCSKMSW